MLTSTEGELCSVESFSFEEASLLLMRFDGDNVLDDFVVLRLLGIGSVVILLFREDDDDGYKVFDSSRFD